MTALTLIQAALALRRRCVVGMLLALTTMTMLIVVGDRAGIIVSHAAFSRPTTTTVTTTSTRIDDGDEDVDDDVIVVDAADEEPDRHAHTQGVLDFINNFIKTVTVQKTTPGDGGGGNGDGDSDGDGDGRIKIKINLGGVELNNPDENCDFLCLIQQAASSIGPSLLKKAKQIQQQAGVGDFGDFAKSLLTTPDMPIANPIGSVLMYIRREHRRFRADDTSNRAERGDGIDAVDEAASETIVPKQPPRMSSVQPIVKQTPNATLKFEGDRDHDGIPDELDDFDGMDSDFTHGEIVDSLTYDYQYDTQRQMADYRRMDGVSVLRHSEEFDNFKYLRKGTGPLGSSYALLPLQVSYSDNTYDPKTKLPRCTADGLYQIRNSTFRRLGDVRHLTYLRINTTVITRTMTSTLTRRVLTRNVTTTSVADAVDNVASAQDEQDKKKPFVAHITDVTRQLTPLSTSRLYVNHINETHTYSVLQRTFIRFVTDWTETTVSRNDAPPPSTTFFRSDRRNIGPRMQEFQEQILLHGERLKSRRQLVYEHNADDVHVTISDKVMRGLKRTELKQLIAGLQRQASLQKQEEMKTQTTKTSTTSGADASMASAADDSVSTSGFRRLLADVDGNAVDVRATPAGASADDQSPAVNISSVDEPTTPMKPPDPVIPGTDTTSTSTTATAGDTMKPPVIKAPSNTSVWFDDDVAIDVYLEAGVDIEYDHVRAQLKHGNSKVNDNKVFNADGNFAHVDWTIDDTKDVDVTSLPVEDMVDVMKRQRRRRNKVQSSFDKHTRRKNQHSERVRSSQHVNQRFEERVKDGVYTHEQRDIGTSLGVTFLRQYYANTTDPAFRHYRFTASRDVGSERADVRCGQRWGTHYQTHKYRNVCRFSSTLFSRIMFDLKEYQLRAYRSMQRLLSEVMIARHDAIVKLHDGDPTAARFLIDDKIRRNLLAEDKWLKIRERLAQRRNHNPTSTGPVGPNSGVPSANDFATAQRRLFNFDSAFNDGADEHNVGIEHELDAFAQHLRDNANGAVAEVDNAPEDVAGQLAEEFTWASGNGERRDNSDSGVEYDVNELLSEPERDLRQKVTEYINKYDNDPANNNADDSAFDAGVRRLLATDDDGNSFSSQIKDLSVPLRVVIFTFEGDRRSTPYFISAPLISRLHTGVALDGERFIGTARVPRLSPLFANTVFIFRSRPTGVGYPIQHPVVFRPALNEYHPDYSPYRCSRDFARRTATLLTAHSLKYGTAMFDDSVSLNQPLGFDYTNICHQNKECGCMSTSLATSKHHDSCSSAWKYKTWNLTDQIYLDRRRMPYQSMRRTNPFSRPWPFVMPNQCSDQLKWNSNVEKQALETDFPFQELQEKNGGDPERGSHTPPLYVANPEYWRSNDCGRSETDGSLGLECHCDFFGRYLPRAMMVEDLGHVALMNLTFAGFHPPDPDQQNSFVGHLNSKSSRVNFERNRLHVRDGYLIKMVNTSVDIIGCSFQDNGNIFRALSSHAVASSMIAIRTDRRVFVSHSVFERNQHSSQWTSGLSSSTESKETETRSGVNPSMYAHGSSVLSIEIDRPRFVREPNVLSNYRIMNRDQKILGNCFVDDVWRLFKKQQRTGVVQFHLRNWHNLTQSCMRSYVYQRHIIGTTDVGTNDVYEQMHGQYWMYEDQRRILDEDVKSLMSFAYLWNKQNVYVLRYVLGGNHTTLADYNHLRSVFEPQDVTGATYQLRPKFLHLRQTLQQESPKSRLQKLSGSGRQLLQTETSAQPSIQDTLGELQKEYEARMVTVLKERNSAAAERQLRQRQTFRTSAEYTSLTRTSQVIIQNSIFHRNVNSITGSVYVRPYRPSNSDRDHDPLTSVSIINSRFSQNTGTGLPTDSGITVEKCDVNLHNSLFTGNGIKVPLMQRALQQLEIEGSPINYFREFPRPDETSYDDPATWPDCPKDASEDDGEPQADNMRETASHVPKDNKKPPSSKHEHKRRRKSHFWKMWDRDSRRKCVVPKPADSSHKRRLLANDNDIGDLDCSNGILAGGVCCMSSCGACGGSGCSKRNGGAEGCCLGKIRRNARSCNRFHAPCVVEDAVVTTMRTQVEVLESSGPDDASPPDLSPVTDGKDGTFFVDQSRVWNLPRDAAAVASSRTMNTRDPTRSIDYKISRHLHLASLRFEQKLHQRSLTNDSDVLLDPNYPRLGELNVARLVSREFPFSVRGTAYSRQSYAGCVHGFDSRVNISSSVFRDNFAYMGAVLTLQPKKMSVTPLPIESHIRDSLITHNVAFGDGGVAHITKAWLILVNSKIVNNRAAYSGGVLSMLKSRVRVHRCTVNDNSAGEVGGAFSVSDWSLLQITHSRVTRSVAVDEGGAASVRDWSFVIAENTLFADNTALRGGVAFVDEYGGMEIYGSVVRRNRANHGGALYLTDLGTVILSGRTFFFSNMATLGGAAYIGGELHMAVSSNVHFHENFAYSSFFHKAMQEIDAGKKAVRWLEKKYHRQLNATEAEQLARSRVVSGSEETEDAIGQRAACSKQGLGGALYFDYSSCKYTFIDQVYPFQRMILPPESQWFTQYIDPHDSRKGGINDTFADTPQVPGDTPLTDLAKEERDALLRSQGLDPDKINKVVDENKGIIDAVADKKDTGTGSLASTTGGGRRMLLASKKDDIASLEKSLDDLRDDVKQNAEEELNRLLGGFHGSTDIGAITDTLNDLTGDSGAVNAAAGSVVDLTNMMTAAERVLYLQAVRGGAERSVNLLELGFQRKLRATDALPRVYFSHNFAFTAGGGIYFDHSKPQYLWRCVRVSKLCPGCVFSRNAGAYGRDIATPPAYIFFLDQEALALETQAKKAALGTTGNNDTDSGVAKEVDVDEYREFAIDFESDDDYDRMYDVTQTYGQQMYKDRLMYHYLKRQQLRRSLSDDGGVESPTGGVTTEVVQEPPTTDTIGSNGVPAKDSLSELLRRTSVNDVRDVELPSSLQDKLNAIKVSAAGAARRLFGTTDDSISGSNADITMRTRIVAAGRRLFGTEDSGQQDKSMLVPDHTAQTLTYGDRFRTNLKLFDFVGQQLKGTDSHVSVFAALRIYEHGVRPAVQNNTAAAASSTASKRDSERNTFSASDSWKTEGISTLAHFTRLSPDEDFARTTGLSYDGVHVNEQDNRESAYASPPLLHRAHVKEVMDSIYRKYGFRIRLGTTSPTEQRTENGICRFNDLSVVAYDMNDDVFDQFVNEEIETLPSLDVDVEFYSFVNSAGKTKQDKTNKDNTEAAARKHAIAQISNLPVLRKRITVAWCPNGKLLIPRDLSSASDDFVCVDTLLMSPLASKAIKALDGFVMGVAVFCFVVGFILRHHRIVVAIDMYWLTWLLMATTWSCTGIYLTAVQQTKGTCNVSVWVIHSGVLAVVGLLGAKLLVYRQCSGQRASLTFAGTVSRRAWLIYPAVLWLGELVLIVVWLPWPYHLKSRYHRRCETANGYIEPIMSLYLLAALVSVAVMCMKDKDNVSKFSESRIIRHIVLLWFFCIGFSSAFVSVARDDFSFSYDETKHFHTLIKDLAVIIGYLAMWSVLFVKIVAARNAEPYMYKPKTQVGVKAAAMATRVLSGGSDRSPTQDFDDIVANFRERDVKIQRLYDDVTVKQQLHAAISSRVEDMTTLIGFYLFKIAAHEEQEELRRESQGAPTTGLLDSGGGSVGPMSIEVSPPESASASTDTGIGADGDNTAIELSSLRKASSMSRSSKIRASLNAARVSLTVGGSSGTSGGHRTSVSLANDVVNLMPNVPRSSLFTSGLLSVPRGSASTSQRGSTSLRRNSRHASHMSKKSEAAMFAAFADAVIEDDDEDVEAPDSLPSVTSSDFMGVVAARGPHAHEKGQRERVTSAEEERTAAETEQHRSHMARLQSLMNNSFSAGSASTTTETMNNTSGHVKHSSIASSAFSVASGHSKTASKSGFFAAAVDNVTEEANNIGINYTTAHQRSQSHLRNKSLSSYHVDSPESSRTSYAAYDEEEEDDDEEADVSAVDNEPTDTEPTTP